MIFMEAEVDTQARLTGPRSSQRSLGVRIASSILGRQMSISLSLSHIVE